MTDQPKGTERASVSAPSARALDLESQIRRIDARIGELENQRSHSLKICDYSRSQYLVQRIFELEFKRRSLRLRWERAQS